MDAARGVSEPPPITQGGVLQVQRVQGGLLQPEEPAILCL